MPHKRSLKAKQIRDVDDALVALSFHDPELDEVAFNVTSKALFVLLKRKYGFVHPAAKRRFFEAIENRYEYGEVLSDSKGRGTLQQVPEPKACKLYGGERVCQLNDPISLFSPS